MEDDHDFVIVDKRDALPTESRPPSPSRTEQEDAKEESNLRTKPTLNQLWLHQNLGKFPAKTHARKVARELGVCAGMIYLPGQDEILYEDSDMTFEFRQRRYFYYITGADFPGCAATYDIKRDYLILWVPQFDPRTVLYHGRVPPPEQFLAASDVDDVRYISALDQFLLASLEPGSVLFALHPNQVPRLENPNGPVCIDTTRLAPAIGRARVIKSDYEVAMIRRANAVSSYAHRAVLRHLKRAHNERVLEAVFVGLCTSEGARRQAYPVIAASGINASTLHYSNNNEPLAGRQLVVLDAGAEWKCYASDITRTFPVSGAFSAEAAAIYRIVERMQAECIRRVRPGVAFASLHVLACVIAAAGLLRLGILRGGTLEEIMRAGTVAAFFPHGLGHHVGLEVHDVSGGAGLLLPAAAILDPKPKRRELTTPGTRCPPGRVPSPKRQAVTPEMVALLYTGAAWAQKPSARESLEPNMVVTIEPGIYFCREYLESLFLHHPIHSKFINTAALEKYWDVGGVRIEDDILVTQDGYENLTLAPKGEEMLKLIREGA
ncbi:c05755b2-8d79-42ee-8d3b-c0b63000eeb7 [Thermothielavioides terrestris]|uniref:Xaa-Pro aminopeptidase n=1 Tax=Thermothielavioides terrestris TaxID=2587410 RepID=A0A3S4C6B0_9PEZI|nr:c05755b2-8d79-42ee-8d3b-c0b63000eeb7 [Thermothielavioides terrestris]